jgi:uracil-DNA glycosylase family 4
MTCSDRRGVRVPRNKPGHPDNLKRLNAEVVVCRACPRLVRWREKSARDKVKRFAGQEYWGKPLVGFGDSRARLLLMGLAPAAHGGNRTGRMFTGDESGNFLFRALHRAGYANKPESTGREDGTTLNDCYMTATCRCAPPLNKLLPIEISRCRPFLHRELVLLPNVRVVIGLGRIGFDAAVAAYHELGRITFPKKPQFGHCAIHRFEDITIMGSYHPSQQNTFTGRLTPGMLDRVFRTARSIIQERD